MFRCSRLSGCEHLEHLEHKTITMKGTNYNIELLKQIWENLTPDQRMECLRQADRGDCSTPLELNVDEWKAATHYMSNEGLAKVAHIEGGECEAIQLTFLGKAMLSKMDSNTKWYDISNLRTKASHYVDLIQLSRDYNIPPERADIKETVNGLHDAINRIDVDSLPTALSGFNTNQTTIITEMTIVVSVINGLTALLGDNLPDIKKFDPRAAEALKFCKKVNPIMHQVLQTLKSRRKTDPTFDDEKAMERFNCFAMGDYGDMSIDEFAPRYIINNISRNEAIRRLNHMIDRCDDEQTKWLLGKFKYWRGCDDDVIRELHDAMTEFIRFFENLAQLSPIPSNGNRAEATTRLFSVMEWCKLHDAELKKQLVGYPLTKDIEDLSVLAKHIVESVDSWSSVVGNDVVTLELMNDVAIQIDNSIDPAIRQRKPTSPKHEPETAIAEAATPATSPIMELMLLDDEEQKQRLLDVLHKLVDKKKGKHIALVFLVCEKCGLMTKPTHQILTSIFGDIGTKSGYNNYYSKGLSSYTPEEIKGIETHILPFVNGQ